MYHWYKDGDGISAPVAVSETLGPSFAARYSEWEMQAVMIIVCIVLGAIGYGIIHDQITVRVCLEYFTIGHPPVFGTTSPTLLGLGWGVIATWWVGLPLGVALAIAAPAGSRPKPTVRSLIRPMGPLLVAMAVCALAAGFAGGLLARRGYIFLWEPLFSASHNPNTLDFLPTQGRTRRVTPAEFWEDASW